MAHCQSSEYKMPVEKFANKFIRALIVSVVWMSAPVFGHQDPEIAGYIEVDSARRSA